VRGYEYHPAAEAEYLDAVRYYSRVSAELGLRFVTEVEAAAERARQFPEAWAPLPGNLRRIPLHRFPYRIIYEDMLDRIFIWAVAHTSREPSYWRGRTRERNRPA
jgi:plasmid stabilization system protein ParE